MALNEPAAITAANPKAKSKVVRASGISGALTSNA